MEKNYNATGKRKTSIARVYMKPGKGEITVNGRNLKEYFNRDTLIMLIMQPMEKVEMLDKFDVKVNVCGGGLSGQAGAIKHGISKALLEYDPEFRSVLKRNGFLKRDPRMKERKKYGLKGARARYQYSKR
jgi:small subunit ribosomal protein S9